MAFLGIGKKKEEKTKKASTEVAQKAPAKVKAVKKAEKKTVKKEEKTTAPANAAHALRFAYGDVLIRPRLTEKSGIAGEVSNAYTFEVHRHANKPQIAAAVKEQYKVSPVKVRVINMGQRAVLVRGRRGAQAGYKKAIVYLKKGDKLDLI
jgi:large subunit ribosomal protein L23